MRGKLESLSRNLAVIGVLTGAPFSDIHAFEDKKSFRLNHISSGLVYSAPIQSSSNFLIRDEEMYGIERIVDKNRVSQENLAHSNSLSSGILREFRLNNNRGFISSVSDGFNIGEIDGFEIGIAPQFGAAYFENQLGGLEFLYVIYGACLSAEKTGLRLEGCFGMRKSPPNYLYSVFGENGTASSISFRYNF